LGQSPTALRVGADTLRRGSVTVTNNAGTLRVVANLRVRDEYLPYLELAPRTWPDQAQRVMAIVARSAAAAAVWDPACGCHLSDAGFIGQRAVSAKGYGAWPRR
jgi:hypothetical protein